MYKIEGKDVGGVGEGAKEERWGAEGRERGR